MPSLNDRGELAILPLQGQRTAVRQDQHHRFTGLQQSSQQLFLALRQTNIRTAASLSGPVIRLTHYGDDTIRIFHLLNRFLHQTGILHRINLQATGFRQHRLVRQITSLGEDHTGLIANHFLHSLHYGSRLRRIDTTPCPEQLNLLIRQRAYHSDRPSLSQRQQTLVILQQDNGFTGNMASRIHMLIRECILFRTICVQVAIRVLEQAQFIFRLQYTAASLIDIRLRHTALFQRLLQGRDIAVRHHIHIQAGMQSQGRYGLRITQTMIGHLADRIIIGNDKPIESPLITKQIGQQPAVTRSRNRLYQIKGRHDRGTTSLYSRFIRRKILIKHLDTAHIHRIIITTGLGSAIQGKVL